MKFDCAVIIDCWSVFQIYKELAVLPNWRPERTEYEVKRLETFYKNFKRIMDLHEFDSILYATYDNPGNSLLYKHEHTKEFEQIPQNKKWMYRSNPLQSQNLGNGKVNTLTTDCAEPSHVESLTKNTNKNILVCGRSWQACLHHREVGIENLMNLGYNVFVDSRLVHCEKEHKLHAVPFGITADDLLNDDIVWTTHRLPVEGTPRYRLQKNVYRAVAVHNGRSFNDPSEDTACERNLSLYLN